MSHENRLKRMFVTGPVDATLAKVGVAASVVLLGLWFVAPQVFLLVIPLSTGTACVAYLATRNRQVTGLRIPSLPGGAAAYLPAAVVAGLAVSVLLVWAAGERTVAWYLLAGGVGTLVLAQILLLDDERLDARTVLLQVLVAALVVRLAGLFSTPGYVGVDVWTHVPVYVQGIVDAGSLSAIAGSKYVMAPIYHVFAAIATLLFGSARPAVYLTLGLVIPLSVLFVYGAGKLLLPVRWALLAAALYAFADQFIQWGMHIIPTSLGLVFFLGLVYCVTRLFVGEAERWAVALVFVFSLAVVFTHQVSTFVVLLFLGIAAGVGLVADLVRGWRPTGPTSVVLAAFATTAAVTLVSWANTPFGGDSVFLWEMLEVARRVLAEQAGFLNLASTGGPAPPVPPESPTLVEALVPYVEVVGFALLLAGAVVGGLAMLRWDEPVAATWTYLAVAGGMFVAVFGLSVFGIRFLLPTRWLAFLYVPMVIVAAAGAYYVFRTAPRRAILAVVVVLAVGYPTTMVVAEKATLDSPAFADTHDRFSYTEAEIEAVGTIGAIRPPAVEGQVHTDHPYETLFEPLVGLSGETLPLGAGGPTTDVQSVYRTYQSTGPVKFAIPGVSPPTVYRRTAAESVVCPADRDVVYANDQVRLCVPNAAAGGGA